MSASFYKNKKPVLTNQKNSSSKMVPLVQEKQPRESLTFVASVGSQNKRVSSSKPKSSQNSRK